jgi:glyoxylase-like metal-dependent hydrolase (beta-lactamase superfamily II)
MAATPTVSILLPGASIGTDQGLIAFCSVVLVEGPDAQGVTRRILVDPAHVGRRRFLVDALAARGLAPADIDMVLLTHAHWDHIQNLDVFDHARLLLHPAERRYAGRPHRNDWATPKWTGAVIEQARVEEVAEGAALLPGVTVLDLPGHSPGSIGLAVATREGLAIVTGDALQYAYVALTGVNPLVFWNPARARQSIERVVRQADVVYPGHDRPFRLTRDRAIEYVVPFQITLTGVTPDMEGVSFTPPAPREPWVMPGWEEAHPQA